MRSEAAYDGEPDRYQDGEVVEEHQQVLGGRGQLRCSPMNRHTFSATFSNAEGPPVLNPIGQHQGFQELSMRTHDPRTYCIKSAGYDILRSSILGVLPLRLSELQNLPAGAVLALKSQIKMAIRLWDYVDRQPILIDWGQEVEVLCETLQIGINGPDNLIYVPPDNDRAFFDAQPGSVRTGSVVDSVLDISVWAVEETRNLNRAILTTNHIIAATTNPVIQVPTNAIAVTGYQSALGAATASWQMFYGTLNAVGSIPWVARKTVDDEIPLPNVSHLQPDIDPVNNRTFTLSWVIQL